MAKVRVKRLKLAAGATAALTAARRRFDEAAHPRGRGGKFVKKGTPPGGGVEITPAGRAALKKAAALVPKKKAVRVRKPKPPAAAKKPAAKPVRVKKARPAAKPKAKAVRARKPAPKPKPEAKPKSVRVKKPAAKPPPKAKAVRVAKPKAKAPAVDATVPTPGPSPRVKAYAGATDAAVEVHARVLEAAALPDAVRAKYEELGRRGQALQDRYTELLSEVTKDKPVRGAKAEFGRVNKEIGKIYKARNELYDRKLELDRGLRGKAHAAVLFDEQAAVPIRKGKGAVNAASLAAVRDGFEFTRRLVGPGSPLEQQGTGILYHVDDGSDPAAERAFAFRSDASITSRDNVSGKTVAHEIGHHVEFTDPAAGDAARAFRAKRLAESGEAVRPLNDIYREKGRTADYKEDEAGFDDKFHSPYCGKIYGDGSTEIISMGVDRMYSDPVEFAKNDPEYFQMIITVTQGNRRKL